MYGFQDVLLKKNSFPYIVLLDLPKKKSSWKITNKNSFFFGSNVGIHCVCQAMFFDISRIEN
jgi:hypothetical protein